MDIAVFSDIHSNHVALQACIDYITKYSIHNIIFLGDYVTTCAYPEKTLDCIYTLMKNCECWFIKGNREELLLQHHKGADDNWVIPSMTSGTMLYTYNNLRSKDIDFFERMDICGHLEVTGLPGIAFCHGSMKNVDESMYVGSKEAKNCLDHCNTNLILCGHTHMQGTVYRQYNRKILNPGAIGIPLNKEGKAEFMILRGENKEWREEFVQVDYDRIKTADEMDDSGLIEASSVFGRIYKNHILTGNNIHDIRKSIYNIASDLYIKENDTKNSKEIPEKYYLEAADKLRI